LNDKLKQEKIIVKKKTIKSNTSALRGLATVSFFAADHAAAKKWYTQLLGFEPYFERPGYAEFRIGDYEHELGIIDSKYAPVGFTAGPAGAVVYWHVDDVNATFERLLSMGAKQLEAPQDRGEGFVTATVIDPFGNILGVMHNPHYLEVLGSAKKG
jgi:predicted enzyme related to lactoylglutathione lyase